MCSAQFTNEITDSLERPPTYMKVAAVQLGLHPKSLEKALEEAETQVRTAARRGARLVCLPEHWLLAHVMSPGDPVLHRLGALAQDTRVYLNTGGNFLKRRGVVRLSSQTLSPEGEILSTQDKMHLYRREKKRASPGRRLRIVKVEGYKVGVLVCHDLVFPEPARTLVLMGAELLVVPSLIEREGASPWLAYLRARALENRVPIVSPNAYAPPSFLGSSTIIALDYSRKRRIMHLEEKSAPAGSGFVMADLDLKASAGPRAERLGELRSSGTVESLYRALRLGHGK